MNKPQLSLLSSIAEKGHSLSDFWDLDHWLQQLEAEECSWQGNLNQTSSLISYLRKIFYDGWGWDEYLIRGAKDISPRYEAQIISAACNPTTGYPNAQKTSSELQQSKQRIMRIRASDPICPERAGQIPEIYAKDHQEVKTLENCNCDLAHVLAGLDASNHPSRVSPLPSWCLFLAPCFPNVRSNMDLVTWLGDLASYCGALAFAAQKGQKLSVAERQDLLSEYASAADLLGDIDSYVIAFYYKHQIQSDDGPKPSQILKHYYTDSMSPRFWRIHLFCKLIGLEAGENFWNNHQSWLKHYSKELLHNTLFQVYSLTDQKWDSIWFPLALKLGLYRNQLEIETTLNTFLEALWLAYQNQPTPPSWYMESLYAPKH